MIDTKDPADTASSAVGSDQGNGFHYARRGSITEAAASDSSIEGYEAERMAARTLLSAAEEKRLLRKIDWHLMTLCSIMFLLKNIDADNVSNARVMNKGSPSSTKSVDRNADVSRLTFFFYV